MSQKDVFLGADCGESHHHFVLLDETGEEELSFQVQNRKESLRESLANLAKAAAGTRINIVLESLYSFSASLVAVAGDLGFTLWQVNPKALQSYRDLEGESNKTDKVDAFLSARMGFFKMKGCRLAARPHPEEQDLRQVSRIHARFTNQQSEITLRLRSQLVEVAPEVLGKEWEGPTYTSKSFRAALARWPGFKGLETARINTIADVLKVGRASVEKRRSQAEALKSLAKTLPRKRELWTLELSMLLAQLELLAKQIKEVDQRLSLSVRKHPKAAKLTAIPGVAAITAAAVAGESLPLVRVSSEAKVATYSGLTPVARRSGKGGRDVFGRGTNKHLLQACYMSAVASLKVSALDRAYYDKQRRRHRGHPKEHVVATIALARQRFKVMYKLMKTDAEYDKEILISSHLARIESCAA